MLDPKSFGSLLLDLNLSSLLLDLNLSSLLLDLNLVISYLRPQSDNCLLLNHSSRSYETFFFWLTKNFSVFLLLSKVILILVIFFYV